MTDNMREFVKFFVMGLAKGGAGEQEPEKEPIAYLYNGVQLPPLPEWDKETYPYAAIVTDGDASEYRLWVDGSPFVVRTGTATTLVTAAKKYVCSGDAWESYDTGSNIGIIVWSNHDVYFASSHENAGELALAASDPVPVYE